MARPSQLFARKPLAMLLEEAKGKKVREAHRRDRGRRVIHNRAAVPAEEFEDPPGGLDHTAVEGDQRCSGSDPLALGDMHVEADPFEFHGVDTNVNQDLHTTVQQQPERVPGRLSRDDDAGTGRVRGVAGGD